MTDQETAATRVDVDSNRLYGQLFLRKLKQHVDN